MTTLKQVAFFSMLALSLSAIAADFEGATTEKGDSKGSACKNAKEVAALEAATANGNTNNRISLESCDCSQLDVDPLVHKSWECTVSWKAYKREEE